MSVDKRSWADRVADPKGARAWTLGDVLEGIPAGEEEQKKFFEEVELLAAQCGTQLVGKHPGMQGAVLADLLARWLEGHEPLMRERLLLNHIDMVHQLLE